MESVDGTSNDHESQLAQGQEKTVQKKSDLGHMSVIFYVNDI